MLRAFWDAGQTAVWFVMLKLAITIYMLTGGGRRHVRGSVAVVWLGALHVFAISAAWIVYAGMKHI